MSALIAELKADHARITETLDQVRKMGIASKEGQRLLISAKGFLVAHLSKEDKRLYPELRKLAETDDSVRRMLDTYAKNMDQITASALGFFEKYANGGDGVEFAIEIGRLFAALTQRIKKEEAFLYTKDEGHGHGRGD